MDEGDSSPAAATAAQPPSMSPAVSAPYPSASIHELSPSSPPPPAVAASGMDASDLPPLEPLLQNPAVQTPSGNGLVSDASDAAGEAATLNLLDKRRISTVAAKKPKKKNNNNLWTKSSSRKGKKKSRPSIPLSSCAATAGNAEETFLLTPVLHMPDRNDDNPELPILLSRFHKAEKVELSEDRLTAGSTKGYRMVRASRGVADGAWFFEILVTRLGTSGHTRLGWSTEKGDLQAPVGYDGYSFGYRDIDGAKIHKALRENYGSEGYTEGDVIGFYISLPNGQDYVPKPQNMVRYKGQRYVYSVDGKDDPPKVVPGSEICFFKNGVSQGTAYTDILGGRYYPAASMYTLPNQPNCEVTFNFGPNFAFFPQDFGERPFPQPMSEVPYQSQDCKGDTPNEIESSNGNGNGNVHGNASSPSIAATGNGNGQGSASSPNIAATHTVPTDQP